MCSLEFFDQFRNKGKTNPTARNRSLEAVSTLLSSFGNDVYESNCNEQFMNQDIEYKDLASLTRRDLEMLGIKDLDKQTEMLDVFRDLTKQEYSLDDVLNSTESQDINNQTVECTTSHLDTMRMALAAANLKLKVSPSGDIIVDEKHFASKFVLDALEELKRITDEIERRLITLERTSQRTMIQVSKRRRIIPALVTVTLVAACATFFICRSRNNVNMY